MRAKHFVAEQLLSELAMTPNALHKMAAGIQATAGMEFEMYVPNAAGIGRDSSDYDMEEDYSHDPRPDSIEEIVEFFDQNEMNDSISILKLNNDLHENFQEWCSEQFESEWKSEGKDALRDWIVNNEWDQEDEILIALEELPLTDEEKADAQKAGVENLKSRGSADKVAFGHWHDAVNRADEKLEERTEEEWDYGERRGKGKAYNEARDEMQADMNYDEREWCRDQRWREMSDVMREYAINWPIYSSTDYGRGDMTIDDIAGEFAQMIGRDVNASEDYHGAKREPGKYCLEPDGSLDEPAEGSNDGGLEFISPPLPLAEMMSDLKKVKEWAGKTGCYTNESTGLHINVSVPNVSEDTLDYVKLALLLGDKHVLDEFGRAGNTFCKSAFEEVKTRVRMNPSKATELLAKMKSGLDKFASRAIHNGSTGKYISINNKGGYIEFRSPGGDWLDENFDKIENTLLRTVVALDAAVDPQKSRQEYLKKLYTLLAPSSNDDPINVFARYSAGEFTEMPKETLKFLLNRINMERETSTKSPDAPLPGRKTMRPPAATKNKTRYWFEVRKGGASIEIVAYTPLEAKAEARKQWGVREIDATDDQLTARPLRRYVDTSGYNWQIYRKSDGHVMDTFSQKNEAKAYDDMVTMSPWNNPELYGVRPEPTPAQQVSDIANSDDFAQVTGGQRTPNWEVYDGNTGEMKFQFYAVDGVAAIEQQHMSAYASDQFRVRPIATEHAQWGRWFASAEGIQSPIAVSARNEREALMNARSQNPDETILHVWREGTQPPTTTANSSAPEPVIHLYKVTAPNGHSVNISAISTLLARRIYVANYGTHRTDQNSLTVELLPDPDAAPAATPTPQPTWRVIFGNLNHVDVQAADYLEAKDIVTRRYEAQRAGSIADNGGIIRVQLASGLS